MAELVPLTNAVAARMITSALSGRGGGHALLSLSHARTSVPTAVDAATEAATVNAQAAPPAKTIAAKVAPPVHDHSREHHSARWLLAAV